ncbi:rod shape-determining protein RodA, partial [Eubacteriales bacterium OttesenSCG-928-N13]|nr:rod shape-determining protein RodA [Eubacteriales bacterium OttesenSCG-928-N13]
ALIVAMSLFGVLSIFAATADPVSVQPSTIMEMIQTQPTQYANLQMLWLLAGLFMMAVMLYFDYELYGKYANVIYWANIALLFVVLFMERGQGNMAGWFYWGANATRTIQPSEFGKIAIIIALARLFASRSKPITRVAELLPVLAYIGLPLLLIAAQPDYGTAMVYIVVFGVMLFASGTSSRILIGMVSIAVLALVGVWQWMSMAEDSGFRTNRIMVFIDQTSDLQGAGMQTYNARLAVGSGGLWGKGLFTPGSIASLNFIPFDHTDFVFAIVCETFGFVGAGLLVLGYVVLLVRMIIMSSQAADAFGAYTIIGIVAMMLFHVFENIAMVIGLMPVTGIPLPFISYGGSNLLTNFMAMGVVLNVSMRSKEKRTRPTLAPAARL